MAKRVKSMRVIAGKLKGRNLEAVPGYSTRPTSDKVKESIFNMIGPYFSGGICLDLYAGTGALGIEAISRGMDKAIFIDYDRMAIQTIVKNLQRLNITTHAEVYRNDAEKAIALLSKRGVKFDLVFLDPPYAKEKNAMIIAALIQGNLLYDNAIIVVEHDFAHSMEFNLPSIEKWKENRYGDTSITIFTYSEN